MRRIFSAFFYSLSGLKAAFYDEPAFRQEIILAILTGIVLWILSADALQIAIMCLSLTLIFITELINTAIEATIDRIGKEIHPLAKKAKDTASAAVLLAIINWMVMGYIFLWN